MNILQYESSYGDCRGSSDEQAKHGTSLADQKKTITKMSLYLFDKEPDGFYVDDGVSGTLDFDRRPDGKKLQNVLEPNDVVLVAKLDRLIRRLRVLCSVRDAFNELNIHLFAHDILGGAESITTSKSPNVNMFVNMMGTFAEWDKEETARKLYQGKMACVEQGRHIGGGTPYGFELIKNGRHKYLKEIPEQQEIIAYVDKSLQRHKAKGRKTPWRSISKQIKSLYKADIPPWKVSRIALRKLKDRASV